LWVAFKTEAHILANAGGEEEAAMSPRAEGRDVGSAISHVEKSLKNDQVQLT
jgi:hypothetical protein